MLTVLPVYRLNEVYFILYIDFESSGCGKSNVAAIATEDKWLDGVEFLRHKEEQLKTINRATKRKALSRADSSTKTKQSYTSVRQIYERKK